MILNNCSFMENRRSIKVALWGYYNHGNFGDDLMAVIIHRFLTEAGYDVRVYGLCSTDANEFGIATVADVRTLVDWADVVVLGGGGLFIQHEVAWPKLVALYRELDEIVARCERSQKPMLGVSLGGSGKLPLREWQQSAMRFLEIAEFCTFRNPSDMEIGRSCKRCEVEWHSDIVWLTSAFFPVERHKLARPRIAINISAKAGGPLSRLGLTAIERVIGFKGEADAIYLDAVNSDDAPSNVMPNNLASPRNRCYKFIGIRQDLEFLANSDLLIARRLHVGVAAMSYGVPMVSYLGADKTQLLLHNAGLWQNHINLGKTPSLLWHLAKKERWSRRFHAPNDKAIATLQQDAQIHLSKLLQALDKTAALSEQTESA
jgi:hypothetical protein